MDTSLLTYQQACERLKPMRVTPRTLAEWASKRKPERFRLRVVRLGHRTVGIRPQDLAVWVARRAGEAI